MIDFSIVGDGKKSRLFGGRNILAGARIFDISSLTKSVVSLICWKDMSNSLLSPEGLFREKMPHMHNAGDRNLRNFLSYTVQDYGFDRAHLRNNNLPCVRDTLSRSVFGPKQDYFRYDNFASVYLQLLLEYSRKKCLESIIRDELLFDNSPDDFCFHPIQKGIPLEYIVPTKLVHDGLVHDPLAFHHIDENLATAGIFSTAPALADIFYNNLVLYVDSYFHKESAQNQLLKDGIKTHEYALGFDIPYKKDIEGLRIEDPLVCAGWTGCRLFFTRNPLVVVCILTNRVLCGGDSEESRKRFSQFFWEVIRETVKLPELTLGASLIPSKLAQTSSGNASSHRL